MRSQTNDIGLGKLVAGELADDAFIAHDVGAITDVHDFNLLGADHEDGRAIVHQAIEQPEYFSLGADIDTKCLAALENWHFHPATRNGAPIPSKQDAIFPFHARG